MLITEGRNLYDITFLSAKTRSNYAYLHRELDVKNADALKTRLNVQLAELDLSRLAKDVSPFLFYTEDGERVLLFPQFVEQTGF